jgi:hypothetical protein
MDVDVEQLVEGIAPREALERRRDGWWIVSPDLDVRAMAALMVDHDVRLATATGVPGADGVLRLIYHWDLGATILNVQVSVRDGHIATICDLIPGADWVERELRDYFAVSFEGRPQTLPLMLSGGDTPGFFNRTADAGRDADPAETAQVAAQTGEEAR